MSDTLDKLLGGLSAAEAQRQRIAELEAQLSGARELSELRQTGNRRMMDLFKELAAAIEDDEPTPDSLPVLVSLIKQRLTTLTTAKAAAERLHEVAIAAEVEERQRLANELVLAQTESARLTAQLASVRAEAQKDYDDMRRFQGEVIRLTHEGNELTERAQSLWDENARLQGIGEAVKAKAATIARDFMHMGINSRYDADDIADEVERLDVAAIIAEAEPK